MPRTRLVVTALFAVLVVAGTAPSAGLAAAPGSTHQAAAGTAQDCSFPFSSVDATGTEVTVEEAPQRVVTANPSAAQTMWELGARGKVVGVTKFATYLEGADEKENISGGGFGETVVVEKVVALEPDLVLVPNANDEGTVEKLREAGLTVYMFERAESLSDISEKTRVTGRLVGECAAAEGTVERMEADIDTVREAVEGSERPDVLFVLGPSGFTAGADTFIDTAIDTAGGNNIAAEENISGYDVVSEEVVADRDPDWIVKPSGVSLPDSEVYQESTAVQESRVLAVDRNFISQPAPQIVRAIVTMAKAFHPEAYAEANATATPTPTATPEPTISDSPVDTPMSTATDTPTQTPASTDTPGFGPVAAVAGLLVALLLVRRD